MYQHSSGPRYLLFHTLAGASSGLRALTEIGGLYGYLEQFIDSRWIFSVKQR